MRYNLSEPFVGHPVWDTWNVAHIARHEVTREEVEEVCHGPYIHREAYKRRIMVVGPTTSDRMLAIILEPVDIQGVYLPVTARPASRRERRLYQEELKGDET